MTTRRLTPDDQDEIVYLYDEEWLTYAALGELYGTSWATIRNLLIRRGVKLRGRGYHSGRHFSDRETTDMIRRYQDGESVRALAILYDANTLTISKHLRDNDIHVRSGAQRKRDRIPQDEVVTDYRSGMTGNDVMRKHHISIVSLRRILKAHGVLYRQPSDRPCITFSHEIIQQIVREYVDLKMAIRDIASKHDVDAAIISRTLRQTAVRIDGYERFRPSMTEEREIVDAYVRGDKLKDISLRHHRNHRIVTRVLRQHGIEIRSHLQTSSRRFGYTGTYKHYVFRSLMELSFILAHEADHKVESAERLHKVPYRFDGKMKTYYPDFILDDRHIIEIKPNGHMSDPKVKAKARAMARYCRSRGLTFEMRSWPTDKPAIRALILDGSVRVLNRTQAAIREHLDISIEALPDVV